MIDDETIIELFFERSEQAIRELDMKYGEFVHNLSYNLVNDKQDAEECVNDAYLGAWNTIPPTRPSFLRAYICKTVCMYTVLFEKMQKNSYNKLTYSELFECAMVDFIEKDIRFYTSQISPLYTIVGSKNSTMQKATTDAVAAMNLDTANMELVDACCATGALFFGLQHYE